MKKNIKFIIVFIAVLLIITGCNNDSSPVNNQSKEKNYIENISVTKNIENNDNEDEDNKEGDTSSQYEKDQQIIINDNIENYSFETPDIYQENMADNWLTNSWGNLDAKFAYLDEGHTGEHSVMVEISNYSDGDAKWYFKPIALIPGDYLFSDFYRSDVDSKVMVVVTTNDGETRYINLYNAPASKDWTRYESSFMIPDNAKEVTVYHLLARDGYLIVDDYQISSYSYEGFSQGIITISFDDGWMTNSETALPIMMEYGYKSNQFYATKYIQEYTEGDPFDLIKPFIDAGHEIGSHTVSHSNLSKLSEEELVAELVESKIYLENYLMTDIDYFASPYGIYDAKVNEKILEHYKAHRTVDYGYNSKDNYDNSRLLCMPVVTETTVDDVAKWIQKAKNENLWLILLFHNIKDDPANYGSTPQMFAECMKLIYDADVPVMTISEAIGKLEKELN